jgi:hypothetical protein
MLDLVESDIGSTSQALLTKKKMSAATPPRLNEVVQMIAQGAASSAASAMVSRANTVWRGLVLCLLLPRRFAHFAMGLADLFMTTWS